MAENTGQLLVYPSEWADATFRSGTHREDSVDDEFDLDIDYDVIFNGCDYFGSPISIPSDIPNCNRNSSSDGDLKASPVKKARKAKKRKPNRIPRIYMNDVRRHYGSMLARVFNSVDDHVAHVFVHSFSRTSSPVLMHSYHHEYLKGITSDSLCPALRAMSYGMRTTLSEWFKTALFVMRGIFPDLVCRVLNEQLVVAFEDDFLSLLKYLYQRRVYEESLRASDSDSAIFATTTLKTPRTSVVPSQYTHVVRFMLNLDELKRIESIEVQHETPPPYVLPLLDQARDKALQ